ncbi:MAG: bifunctional acetate--CoA ligase family protein/GNAT family N-acetyltransferase [Deltaproteobacteria bacterium]|nr:bifunctional acetate--CoA ligase family protein/GNAT family N-acetyltransferase [Deltaproteobacteria bacterium]
MDKIFAPAHIAVIGAGNKEGSIGYALMNNIQRGGYPGKLFPINPKYTTVSGLNSYPSIGDVGEPVDLAVIATPISTVPAIIQECVAAKVRGAIIVSAGGKEIGQKGREIELNIKEKTAGSGIRIIGPNCVGVICTHTHLHATFADRMPLKGKMAFVSQSGALIGAIIDVSLKKQIGFSHFISVGSMLDADFGDLLDYLGNDPHVNSIVLYMEGLTHPRKFMSAARSVSRIKPIIVLKSGISASGAKAAASHTGAMAGEDAIYDAAFRRAGIIRVNTIEALFDVAELAAKQPVPKGAGLAIVTNGGGPGVMAADALSSLGLAPVGLRPETTSKLDAFLPPFWSRGNPIDILGDATPERYRRTVEICLSAQEINGLVIVFVPQAVSDGAEVATSLVETLQGKSYPIFAVWMGDESVRKGREILSKAGIPTYETPERAIESFMYMHAYSQNLELLQQTPPKLHRTLQFRKDDAEAIINHALDNHQMVLTEPTSKALLSCYNVPVNRTEIATSLKGAVHLAQAIGYPVVMKICSRDISHKSDAHGVQLNLRNDEDAMNAFEKIMAGAHAYDSNANIEGVSIQSMMEQTDYELILGSKNDPVFGPVLLFGMGGVMTEILKDQAIAFPPLNRLLARRMMESTRVYQLLKGYRNRPPADLDQLEEILISLSQLVADFPEIVELDINPLILFDNKPFAVDARVILKPSQTHSPLHLAISPYPAQYESVAITESGIRIFIRPIKPEDEPLLSDFFTTLSPESIYTHFSSPMKSMPRAMLARFTQIDYDRDMALVAMRQNQSTEAFLGMARLMSKPGGIEPEFSVVIGDRWQGKGIGASLMKHLIAIAKERGLSSIWGVALAENIHMLALARKFGSTVEFAGGSHYKLKIDVESHTENG